MVGNLAFWTVDTRLSRVFCLSPLPFRRLFHVVTESVDRPEEASFIGAERLAMRGHVVPAAQARALAPVPPTVLAAATGPRRGGRQERPGEAMRHIRDYQPDLPEVHWTAIREFVVNVVVDVYDDTTYRSSRLLNTISAFVHWCWLIGMPLDRDGVFSIYTIEEFIVHGSPQSWSSSTRGDHRSLLMRVAESLGTKDAGVRLSRLPKADPQAPYTQAEQFRMVNWAGGQTTHNKRRDAATLLALGLGAGLSAGEIGDTTCDHIVIDEFGVMVRVGGDRPRVVPVLARWEAPIMNAVGELRSGYVFGPNRATTGKNLVNNFVSRCSRPLVPVVSHRLRGTWIVHHLSAGTPLGPFLAACGVTSFTSLSRYLKFLPEGDPTEVRARLRGALREGSLRP